MKNEGDVVISSLTGQPFFNPLSETNTPDTIADSQLVTVQTVPLTTALSSTVVSTHSIATMLSAKVSKENEVTQTELTSEISLGDEQGAPIFAAYTLQPTKENIIKPIELARYDGANTITITPTVAVSTLPQQLNMTQQGQSNQQQTNSDANSRLSSSTNTEASTSESDSDSFSTLLTTFSPTQGAGAVSNPLSNPLSFRQPQWTQEMGNRMQMMVSQRLKEVEVRLDPVELGPVRIHLKTDKDNKTHVTLSAQHGLTRDMLENALPRLRDMLAQQGIDIGSATVNADAQQQTSDQQQKSSQNKGADLSEDAANSSSEVPIWKPINGLVDHFV
jgi:flagellar hook-length control protein FliK